MLTVMVTLVGMPGTLMGSALLASALKSLQPAVLQAFTRVKIVAPGLAVIVCVVVVAVPVIVAVAGAVVFDAILEVLTQT